MRAWHVMITVLMATALGVTALQCTHRAPHRPGQLSQLNQAELVLPTGQAVQIFIAQTPAQRFQGLSEVRPEAFGPAQGMLFVYSRPGRRVFSMRRTYFDLDIFFLNSKKRVVAAHRDLPHHPDGNSNHRLRKTPPVRCRYVLEMRADSDLAEKIHPGMHLQWQLPAPSSHP